MRIDTKEDKLQKLAQMITGGGDTRQGLDLVRRSDYATDDDYLDACAKAEMERKNPEYKAVRARLRRELEERQEKEYQEQQNELHRQARASAKLSPFDVKTIDEEATTLARRDRAAGRVSVSGLAEAIEGHAKRLTEKRLNELASNAVMNAMIMGNIGGNKFGTATSGSKSSSIANRTFDVATKTFLD